MCYSSEKVCCNSEDKHYIDVSESVKEDKYYIDVSESIKEDKYRINVSENINLRPTPK